MNKKTITVEQSRSTSRVQVAGVVGKPGLNALSVCKEQLNPLSVKLFPKNRSMPCAVKRIQPSTSNPKNKTIKVIVSGLRDKTIRYP